MKAKEVVKLIEEVKPKTGEQPGEFGDRQAAVLLDCGFKKFKENVNSRWPQGKAKLQSIVSLRREFTQWGEAISRMSSASWIRPTAGTVVFDTILREVERQTTGGEVLLNTIHVLDAKPDVLRSGL